MEQSTICSICHQSIQANWFYCPNCGNPLQPKPLSISLWEQTKIYLISFLLPPFGLGYAFKYLKDANPKAKLVGIIAILLTIASLVLVILSVQSFMEYYAKLLNDISNGYYP